MTIIVNNVDTAISAAHWCSNNLSNLVWDVKMCGSAEKRYYEFTFTNEHDMLLFTLSLR